MPLDEKVKILSVTELTRDLKGTIENSFPALWVEGEASNVKKPSSGHLYFTLKDANAQIQAVFFSHRGRTGGFSLEDGMKVIVFGAVTVYEKHGNYQINIKKMEPAGIGALQLAFEQLKKKLFEEGLFNPARKKSIPLLPSKIGIITSPTGAALRDIMNVLERRFSDVHIIIAPTLVQGDTAPGQIVKALDLLNEMNEVEVIVVTRGGGSIEDLWAFNDEGVARAIHRSLIPVISAVGHEIDWTIADFVADLRCPTPTAAAELVITKKSDLLDRINQMGQRMQTLMMNRVQMLKKILQSLSESTCFKYPKAKLEEYSQTLDTIYEKCVYYMAHIVERKKSLLEILAKRLEALSPLAILNRGYSLTLRLKDGAVLKENKQVQTGEEIETRLSKGRIISVVKVLKTD
jgi:exodeoxyribonuclease VII large subunit